jgi:hypothetical protein
MQRASSRERGSAGRLPLPGAANGSVRWPGRSRPALLPNAAVPKPRVPVVWGGVRAVEFDDLTPTLRPMLKQGALSDLAGRLSARRGARPRQGEEKRALRSRADAEARPALESNEVPRRNVYGSVGKSQL